jgi:D-proline reductase (dithiol) PrdB
MNWKEKWSRLLHDVRTKFVKAMIGKEYKDTPFHTLEKPLNKCKVALVTTAGVHLKQQTPFNTTMGDWTYRKIPSQTDVSELTVSHTHYDTSEALKDINVVFPIERLNELVEKNIIGSSATNHFGFMGYIPYTKPLIKGTAVEVARQFVDDGVDIVILTPG